MIFYSLNEGVGLTNIISNKNRYYEIGNFINSIIYTRPIKTIDEQQGGNKLCIYSPLIKLVPVNDNQLNFIDNEILNNYEVDYNLNTLTIQKATNHLLAEDIKVKIKRGSHLNNGELTLLMYIVLSKLDKSDYYYYTYLLKCYSDDYKKWEIANIFLTNGKADTFQYENELLFQIKQKNSSILYDSGVERMRIIRLPFLREQILENKLPNNILIGLTNEIKNYWINKKNKTT